MPQHSGRKHYLYSASGSERWMACAASIARASAMPEGTSSTYALDGTEAHELLEMALVNGYLYAREAFLLGDFKWTHRHDTEDDRINSVQAVLDDVNDTLAAYPDAKTFFEVQFQFPTPETEDAGGTSDIALYVEDFDLLHITDFKHGAGKAVEVHDNPQLLFYAVGVRQELRRQGLCTSGRTAYVLRIIQPRAFHKSGPVREWITDDARLDRFIGDVGAAIRKTRAQAPVVKPGPWCRWCPAYTACPEAERDRIERLFPGVPSVNALAAYTLPDVVSMDVEKLAKLLEAGPMIREFLDAAEQQALALARQGVDIPRHKLVYAQARRKWQNPDRETAVALGHIVSLPPDTFLRTRVVGITEAEDLLREAVYKHHGGDKRLARKDVKAANEAMATLTTKDTSGNLVLTDYADKRPAVNIAAQIPYKPV